MDLRGYNEGDEHHEGEHEEADVVVPLPGVHLALGVGPHVRIVEDDAHDEHEDTPPDTPVHPLGAVQVLRGQMLFSSNPREGEIHIVVVYEQSSV